MVSFFSIKNLYLEVKTQPIYIITYFCSLLVQFINLYVNDIQSKITQEKGQQIETVNIRF